MTGKQDFLDEEGRLRFFPSKRAKREEALSYLSGKFDFGKFYTEKEVNAILREWHTFGDYFLLRRELIEGKLLHRTRDGAKYWKADFFTGIVTLNGIEMRDCFLEDKQAVLSINDACEDYVAFAGREFTQHDADSIVNGIDLPPNGFSEFANAKLILCGSQREPVGYFAYYLGYPDGGTAYIASLFIRGSARGKGTGSAAVGEFARYAVKNGISTLRIGVMTENAPGLAFWHRQGFSETGKVVPYEDTGKKVAELLRHFE